MYVFVMRHGEATSFSLKDADRELTDHGRREVSAMIQHCANSFASIDEIWASPYIRTQQTAALVSAALKVDIISCDFLTPTNNSDQTLEMLAGVNRTILLVSHQPLVGTLVDKLAGLEPGRYRMCTAAIACIESELFTTGAGKLEWLYQPEN
ncbi:MAG: phosphohistidine phosphatase [Pseudohongiellaceae bacterium]|jgi:phosphohistidine phosphatase